MHFSPIKIKNLRLERGWSQEHLGDITGLSSRTIQRIESQGNASPESLMAIASAFSLSTSDLSADYNEKIGDGKLKLAGVLGLFLIFASLAFYLTISGDPLAIIDLPALLFVLVVPFSISCIASGFKATLQVYRLILWLVYEQKDRRNVSVYLPVLRKLIIYSYVSGATGSLLSLLGMFNQSSETYYPASISVILLIFIYATLQAEFVFRPLYHKLNRQLLAPNKPVS